MKVLRFLVKVVRPRAVDLYLKSYLVKRRIEKGEVEVEVKVGSKSEEVLLLVVVVVVLAFAGPLPWVCPLKYGRRRASRPLLDSQQMTRGRSGNRQEV